MPVNVNLQSDEPMIVLTVDKGTTPEELVDAYWNSVELAEHRVYRIVDLRKTTEPGVLVDVLKTTVQAAAGAPVEPQLRINFVCKTSDLKKLAASGVASFDDMDAARSQMLKAIGDPLGL